MAETLAQSLRTTTPPANPTAALLRGGSIQSRGTEARKQFPSLLEESATAAGELKRSELQAESEKAGREAAALEESGRKMREETQRIRAQEQPYQEFKAPEYTAFDYAKGAATRALTAVILGGVAKTSALTQLKAIKAMQDAEKEGRQNDFLNAQLTFNEAEKKRVDFNERLKRDLDDFEKLLQTDTKTALAKAKVMTAQMQDGLVRRLIDSQRFGEAIKVARNNIETAEELEKQLTIKAAEAAARKEEKLIEAANKPTRVEQLPSGLEKTLEKVSAANIALNRANQARKPEFFGIAPLDTVADAIVSGVEKDLPVGDIMRMVGVNAPKVTKEAVDWWKDYQSFVAQVRNNLFGATLTPREAGDFRKFNVGPATAPDVAENYFNRQVEIVKNAVERERAKGRARGVSEETLSAYLDLPEDMRAAPAPAPSGQTRQMSDEDRDALNWANSNPNDPRAAQIKRRLGVTDGF
jgi:hypothetical protein